MKHRTRVTILELTIAIFFTAVSCELAGASDVPSGCEGKCEQQFLVLADLDAATSLRRIEEAFGAPSAEAIGKLFSIAVYRGDQADLLVLQDAAKAANRLAYAVITRNFEPAATRLVATPLLWAIDQRKLAHVSMEFALNNCSGDVQFSSTKLDLAWTPACYFGGPGNYKNFAFLLFMNGADCEKHIDDAPFR